MSTSGQNALTVTLREAPPVAQLETQWRQLEAHADASFFTTWSWIGCWLDGLEPHHHVQLLHATRGGQTVGLGLLIAHDGKRLKLLPSRGIYLHATGDTAQDELAVEHNGLLLHRDAAEEIEQAMYAHLMALSQPWDRLELPGLSRQQALDNLARKHNSVVREESRPSYYVDLEAVRQRGSNYLGMLSASTRSQIRRSLKAYGELGSVTLTEAQDLDTALHYLDQLEVLHQRHWLARGKPGAFANPVFNEFHQRQITDGFAHGHVQLLRVQAGSHDIGYLYNFVHRGQVLFYQSGFDYALIAKHGRPGLVAHALGIQHNAQLGHTAYDFLAGDTRYKHSLSSGVVPMAWVTVHRDTWSFRLEDRLRRIKRQLMSRTMPSAEDTKQRRDSEILHPYPLVAAGVLAIMQAITPANMTEVLRTAVVEDSNDDLRELMYARRPELLLGY
ncbi:MAG: GNAT family N-acetyltransferase [Rhizobacter sp.]